VAVVAQLYGKREEEIHCRFTLVFTLKTVGKVKRSFGSYSSTRISGKLDYFSVYFCIDTYFSGFI
jgi:hypothetical protein